MAHKRKTVTDLDQRVIERKKKYVEHVAYRVCDGMSEEEHDQGL